MGNVSFFLSISTCIGDYDINPAPDSIRLSQQLDFPEDRNTKIPKLSTLIMFYFHYYLTAIIVIVVEGQRRCWTFGNIPRDEPL